MPEEPAYSSAEEPQLVQWAKVGDMQAFEELVARYRDRIYVRAYSIMRNEDSRGGSFPECVGEGVAAP